jgi:protein gp37
VADKTAIEWTDATWTPIRAMRVKASGETRIGWHCEHVTEACRNCYAESINARLGTGLPFKPGHLDDVALFLDEKILSQPLRWTKPRMIFVCSMTDLFGRFVPDEMIDRVYAVAALAQRHTFQVLSERPDRMRAYLSDPSTPGRIARILIDEALIAKRWRLDPETWPVQSVGDIDQPDDVTIRWPLPNVWHGVSVHDQPTADAWGPILLDTPSAVRWLSVEPMLGPIRLLGHMLGFAAGNPAQCATCGHGHGFSRCPNTGGVSPTCHVRGCSCSGFRHKTGRGIDWVVAGGESGPKARPMHPDWVRSLRDQCARAGVPFLFKQWGEFREFDHEAPIEEVEIGTEHADSIRACAVRPVWQTLDGRVFRKPEQLPPDVAGRMLERLGKRTAGRSLDGRTWDGYPARAP